MPMKKNMSASELGRRGGKATVKKYGKAHFRKISRAYWKNKNKTKKK